MHAGKSLRRMIGRLRETGLTLVTAESLTGGLVGAAITAVPGVSDVYWGGIVSYSVEAKVRLLSVDPATIERFGAVSTETASSMALGALGASSADIAVAVTGVAGPGGGSADVPVGTVCIGLARRRNGRSELVDAVTAHFPGPRWMVRNLTVRKALVLVRTHLDRE